MGLGPKQMQEAILKNLQAKTGKTIEQWVAIIEKTKRVEKKEIMDFLKKKKGLGQFQALAIFNEMNQSNAYQEGEKLIHDLFTEKGTLAIFQQLQKEILKLDKAVRMQPCKTYIPFYRNKQFAVLYPNPSGAVLLAVNLPEDFSSAEFKKAKSRASARINFQTTLSSKKELNPRILAALQLACANN